MSMWWQRLNIDLIEKKALSVTGLFFALTFFAPVMLLIMVVVVTLAWI